MDKSDANNKEEKILEFWQKNDIFQKTLNKKSPKGEFVFYEGPPTANAKPALHHLEARAFKDVIPRYKTMQGFHVRRKAGWDTHGLPVELQVEKKLGLQSKKEIEKYGIAKFNKECRQSVWEHVGLWSKFTDRIGFWVDQDDPYITYENDYIESVWNVVSEVDKQKLLYKDYKVVPWCPRCGTALSSHELAQGYQDVRDLSITAKLKVKSEKLKNLYILAWTTTPWTLPGNVALAVGKDIDYVKVKRGDEIFILAKDRLGSNFPEGEYEIVEEMKGKDLVSLEYEPLYPYLEKQKPEKIENAYKVYSADFVTTEDGTGVVHTAVMYGQDDFELGNKVDLPKHHLVSLDGKFLPGTEFLEGKFVRDEETAVDIIKDLARRGLLFSKEKYAHSYPHCWRCKTALIYYARDSWYIRMSDGRIKEQLITENNEINWEPSHIREGRFGEWLRDIKDWAISRERYWGTPLPVWLAEDGEKLVVDSLDTLKNFSKKSGNKYLVMRHGGTEGNKAGLASYAKQADDHLTEAGKAQVTQSAEELKGKIDYIITSPFVRTQETAEVVREVLGLEKEKVKEEYMLREIDPGEFDGKKWTDWHEYMYSLGGEWFTKKTPKGESFQDVKRRTAEVLYTLEQKYKGKNILLVTHGATAWVLFVNALLYEPRDDKFHATETHDFVRGFKRYQNAEVRELPFVPLPHNEDYELDLHRPYIDKVVLEKDSKEFRRTPEVMDVWFDSGAMPFAQDHYPFGPAQDKPFSDQKILYPADFISEAIDQTRGWFYTLHAIGVLMGRGRAYQNVICLGHLLDAQGKKMSKSVGNVVDPWSMIEKYGVDTLRLWMYAVNQPGESKNFDEKTVALLHNQVFTLLYNVLAFYELFRDQNLEDNSRPRSQHILDRWILARLDELVESATKNIDNYKLLEPVREVREFISDLSTWYLRRSRDRLRGGDNEAKQTLYFILKTLAKIMAPFAPFTAEDIWQKLRLASDPESVHLSTWPKVSRGVLDILDIFRHGDEKVLENMNEVRKVASLGLKERQKAEIQVRQPLAKLKVKSEKLKDKYLDLLKNELNVKEVIYDSEIKEEVELDTRITPALKAEGEYREFMRELQDMRKEKGLNPGDKMPLPIEAIYKKYKIMPNLQEHMLRVAGVASLICDNFDEPLPKDEIVTACLLHDMGNIIKFDLSVFPEFNEPEGLEYWQGVKDEYIEKYNNDVRHATGEIVQEIGVSSRILELISSISFSGAPENARGKDFGIKIVDYADARVNPFGVVTPKERLEDFKKRYAHKGGDTPESQAFADAMDQIEKQIFAKCKIKPEDINDEAIEPVIEELRNFVVK